MPLILPNEYFEEAISNKNSLNLKYSKMYIKMHNDDDNFYFSCDGGKKFLCDTYLKKGYRISECMDLSLWDKYDENKVLDLALTNRCMDNRFCPNCKRVDISRFISNFYQAYSSLETDYIPFMLTLTVPNCEPVDLDYTIKRLSLCFRKLIKYLNKQLVYPFGIPGGVRVLEVTYNDNSNTYHPHYHCLVLFRKCDYDIYSIFFNKIHKHLYSVKSCDYNYLSDYCIYITKIWSLIWQNKRLSRSNLDMFDFIPGQACCYDIKWLQCDLSPLDDKGVYEIFKYTFKDADIVSYDVFKTLYLSLSRKRLRQGFGIFYNLKCEDITEEEVEELDLEFKEVPDELKIYKLQELLTCYSDYTKISRKNSESHLSI